MMISCCFWRWVFYWAGMWCRLGSGFWGRRWWGMRVLRVLGVWKWEKKERSEWRMMRWAWFFFFGGRRKWSVRIKSFGFIYSLLSNYTHMMNGSIWLFHCFFFFFPWDISLDLKNLRLYFMSKRLFWSPSFFKNLSFIPKQLKMLHLLS